MHLMVRTLLGRRPWLPFGSSSSRAKMLGMVMASAKKPLEFSDFSEMKLYSDSPAGESRDHHVSGATIAGEAGRAV